MAATAQACCLSLLMLLLSLATAQMPASAHDSSLICFYNSKANISCIWNQERDQSALCRIHAWPVKRTWNKTCDLLLVRPASWACNLNLGDSDMQMLTSADTVHLYVQCQEGDNWRTLLAQIFKPFENLRLMAPDSLHVTQLEANKCNITWNAPQSSHYITKYLEFAVRLRSEDQSWEELQPMIIRQNQQWINLENLAADSLYELQVRVRSQRGSQNTWSPWSQPLAFRTKPAVLALEKEDPMLSQLSRIIVGFCGAVAFILLVTLLLNCPSIGSRLKRILKCHIPDPSEFFSQLSSEHGGDFQKWLASPFPSSSFSPGGPAAEISPLEVLDRDAKAAQLLALQQEKPDPSSPSSHSLTSCFTNQGYFFFHFPDALEIESCQVYFTYDPCTEEPEEGGSGVPEGIFPPLLPPPPGDEDAYCTFPPGDELLFSHSLLGGSSSPHLALQPQGTPSPGAHAQAHAQSLGPGRSGQEVPETHTGEGVCFPWASPPGSCQAMPPHSCLALNTDAYVSLQELQGQDPTLSM